MKQYKRHRDYGFFDQDSRTNQFYKSNTSNDYYRALTSALVTSSAG